MSKQKRWDDTSKPDVGFGMELGTVEDETGGSDA